jgi:hypothetical protein
MTITIQPWMIAGAFLALGLVGGALITLSVAAWAGWRSAAEKRGGGA